MLPISLFVVKPYIATCQLCVISTIVPQVFGDSAPQNEIKCHVILKQEFLTKTSCLERSLLLNTKMLVNQSGKIQYSKYVDYICIYIYIYIYGTHNETGIL